MLAVQERKRADSPYRTTGPRVNKGWAAHGLQTTEHWGYPPGVRRSGSKMLQSMTKTDQEEATMRITRQVLPDRLPPGQLSDRKADLAVYSNMRYDINMKYEIKYEICVADCRVV